MANHLLIELFIYYLSSTEFVLSIGVSSLFVDCSDCFNLSLLVFDNVISSVAILVGELVIDDDDDDNVDEFNACCSCEFVKYAFERSFVFVDRLIFGSLVVCINPDELFGELHRSFLI
jgi:hypothetical protein